MGILTVIAAAVSFVGDRQNRETGEEVMLSSILQIEKDKNLESNRIGEQVQVKVIQQELKKCE